MAFRRLFRYGIVAGATFGTLAALQYNEWDVETFGIIRFGRTAYTASRIMVDYKLSLYNGDKSSEKYLELKSQAHKRSAQKLLDLCCANGGVFIKVGQHLGALDYLLPEEYVSTLKVLHSKAPESPLSDVYHVIKEDLKKDAGEVFARFDPRPIGAASLAQVHRALTLDGQEVAVKVQHRFVKARSFVDLKTMEVLVNIAAWAFPEFNLLWLAEETKKNLPLELDFIHEGKNAERVRRMFRHYSWFKVPTINWDLSTSRVLVMEFCEGGQVNDSEYMQANNVPVTQVTRNLGKLYSEMIFVQGYVHCDPHPGNILVNNDKGRLQIILLDHGLYMTLTDSFRIRYANLWLSMLRVDVAGIQKWAGTLGVKDSYQQKVLASMASARPWHSVTKGIDKQRVDDTEDQEIKAFVGGHLTVITEILNMVPREMLFMFKTNDLLRSIECCLKSPPSAGSFINMTRCCVRAIAQDRLQHSHSLFAKALLLCNRSWVLFIINLHELYVWLQISHFWNYVTHFRH